MERFEKGLRQRGRGGRGGCRRRPAQGRGVEAAPVGAAVTPRRFPVRLERPQRPGCAGTAAAPAASLSQVFFA